MNATHGMTIIQVFQMIQSGDYIMQKDANISKSAMDLGYTILAKMSAILVFQSLKQNNNFAFEQRFISEKIKKGFAICQ
jgi:hypothetical protein